MKWCCLHPNRTIKINIQSIFVYLVMLYCIVFPADALNIKEILLLAVLVVGAPAITSEIVRPDAKPLVFFAIIYPIVTTILSITIGDSRLYDALSFGYVWIYLLMVPIIVQYDVDVKRIFMLGTTIIALIIIWIYLTDIMGLIPFGNNPVGLFFVAINEMQYGKGTLAVFGYCIFHKAVPLLIVSYAYAVYNKKKLLILIFGGALLLSGTRADCIATVLVTLLVPLTYSASPRKKWLSRLSAVIMLCTVVPYIVNKVIAVTMLKFARSEGIKIGHFISIWNHLNADVTRYVFGSGVGSYFYTIGTNKMTNVVEISYFDYFRQVGIVGSLVFVCFIVSPIKYMYHKERWLLIAYMSYLAIAFTNPLLLSSTAFMVYVLIFSCGMSVQKQSLLRHPVKY